EAARDEAVQDVVDALPRQAGDPGDLARRRVAAPGEREVGARLVAGQAEVDEGAELGFVHRAQCVTTKGGFTNAEVGYRRVNRHGGQSPMNRLWLGIAVAALAGA